MASLINESAAPRLERSCGASASDWVRIAPSSPGLDRVEVSFASHGFDAHRHDTYAIGQTLTGVQAFRYRGRAEASLPGQAFVLHPDETHDGHAGTPGGFRYRIVYVAPGAIRAAMEDDLSPLPFVRAVPFAPAAR